MCCVGYKDERRERRGLLSLIFCSQIGVSEYLLNSATTTATTTATYYCCCYIIIIIIIIIVIYSVSFTVKIKDSGALQCLCIHKTKS